MNGVKNKMKSKKSDSDTLSKLVPAFYAMGVMNVALDMVINPMMKAWGQDMQREVRNLKKRGIAVVEIHDKGTIKTYHPIEGVEKMLNEFVEMNDNKWKWEKEVYGGVKTGAYILTRVYRRYYKKRDEEEDCCECCGRAY